MAALLVAASGCATRSLPPYETPLARAEWQKVRTTAYTHTERDHRRYEDLNAMGTALRNGAVKSAAADWARWPAGTRFYIPATGDVYEVDDYGWALAGTNTIDLYKASPQDMASWGVRRVTIRILQWGDPARSYRILEPRAKYRHVDRMLREFRGEI